MSDGDYGVQITLSLPPNAPYEKGSMLNVRGTSSGAVRLHFGEMGFTEEEINSLIEQFKKNALGSAAAVSIPDPQVAAQEAAALEALQTQLGATPIVTPPPAVAPTAAVAAPAPAPAANPAAGAAMPPKVDGSQVGGSPGFQYPLFPGGTTIGGPCPKCGVRTFRQLAFVKPNGDAVPEYWRCPNARNHPK